MRLAVMLCGVASALISAPIPPRVSRPLTAPYTPPGRIVLATGGESQAILLLPEDSRYRAVARQLLAQWPRRIGAALPSMAETGVLRRRPRARTWLVLGNVMTGPVALRLYANHLIAADSQYPGQGGCELRTVPRALDYGADIVFVGGSTPAGAARAAAKLFRRVRRDAGHDTVWLPECIDWESRVRPAPAPLSREEIAARLARARQTLGAFRAEPYRTVCGRFVQAARDYYLSGAESHARLAAGLLHLLANRFSAFRKHPPTFILREIVMAVDQVDDSPAWSDSQRLEAGEWLRRLVEAAMGYWEMRRPIRRYAAQLRGPVWNHETHPALGIAVAAEYLKSHYHLAAAEYWAAVVRFLFSCQTACVEPLEDSANYQWIVPRHTAEYVLATGELEEYFSSGRFRACLEYAVASHDSLGNEATHGDAWQPFGSTAGRLFALGAAVIKEPRCQWMLRRTGRAEPDLWNYPVDIPARPPRDHVGLRVFLVEPARRRAYGIENIPPNRVLDKAVFRSGWDPDADYLMLDGLNVGNHKHLDANAIIRFSTNRRYWLVDMDYIRAAPKYHNSIVVVRDGQCPNQSPASRGDAQVIAAPPFAAELLGQARAGKRAITQSRLSDYGGLDWTRTVFWRAKDYFVVIDTLEARRPGDYLVRAVWRTLGRARIEGNGLHGIQRGAHWTGNADLRVIEDGPRRVVEFRSRRARIVFRRRLRRGNYGVRLVAKGRNTGADSLWVRIDGGPRVACHLPVGEYGPGSRTWRKQGNEPSVSIAADGMHRIELSLREGPGVRLDRLILRPSGGAPIVMDAAAMLRGQVPTVDQPEQHFFIVSATGSLRTLRSSYDYGHGGKDGYYAHYPYAGKFTRIFTETQRGRRRKGGRFTFANLFYVRGAPVRERLALQPIQPRVWAVTGPRPAIIGIGPVTAAGLRLGPGAFWLTARGLLATGGKPVRLPKDRLEAALADLLARARPAPKPGPAPELAVPAAPVIWRREFGARLTALASEGSGRLAAGFESGAVVCLGAGGSPVLRVNADSRVRSLAWAVFRGKRRTVLAGTAAGLALALDARTGKRLWAYACPPFHGRTGSVGVIFPADLDGDGTDSVIAGSDNWHYQALSEKGTLRWRALTVHAATTGSAGDCDGDGRDEIAAGTEYYWPRLLKPNGAEFARFSGGPVTTATAIFDTGGDGRAEAFFAMDDGFVRCLRNGKLAWKANVGGAACALRPLDIDGDGRPEIICGSESFSVYALRADGSQAWRRPLPAAVTGLDVTGSGRIAAGCDNGGVYGLDRRGRVLAQAQAGAPISFVAALGANRVAAAAGRTVLAIRLP